VNWLWKLCVKTVHLFEDWEIKQSFCWNICCFCVT
jgi:hypothetical protein